MDPPGRLIFVDESSTNIALTPRYGRAPKGERVRGSAPRNWGKNVTLISSISSKVKSLLRRAQARVLEVLFEATEAALIAVSADDARDYFEHCGYATPRAHSI